MNTFGERLRMTLKKKNLKSIQLADAVGVSKSTISFYLGDRSFPNQDFFIVVKKIIPDINLDWLITGQGDIFENSNGQRLYDALEKEVKELRHREKELTNALLKVIGGKTPVAKNKGVYVPANLMLHNNRVWFGAKHTVNYTPRFAH